VDFVTKGAVRPRGASDRFGTHPFVLTRHSSPHGQVTAVSMMKDEGPFVLEWVAHHLAIGFTDLVVYTNDCSDGTDDMLIRLEELGLAHHRRNVIPEGLRPQPSALNHAQIEPVVQQSDWVMVFDADEFLSIRHGDGTLDGLLDAAQAQGANGIVVTWRIFGSGGVVEWSRAPVTEQYLMAAPPMWNKGWGVKTLFKFDDDKWKLGIHRPKMKNRHIDTGFPDTVKWLNGSGREMEDYFKFRGWRSITRTVGYDWVQLNHYAVKSVDSYAIRKMRGNVNNKADKYNSDYWSLQDRNEVRDDTMLRYTARRNAIIAQLLTDPVLNRLHHAAIDRAEARLAELKGTKAYRALVADLAAASAVPITQIVAKPPQARDKEKIASLMSEVEQRRSAKAKEARKADPQAKPAITPMGSYASGPIDAMTEQTVEWVPNHGIEVPLDARVFTPPTLAVIAAGKFERGLARRMPQVLPPGARVHDMGAGCGFLAAHLSRARPDLTVTMAEADPGLRATLQRLCARNGLSFGPRFALVDAAPVQPPQSIILGDPAVSPQDLGTLIQSLTPATVQIFLHGRWLEAWHNGLAPVEAALTQAGFAGPAFGFDPVLTRGYGRGSQ
jgi:methylase of polypeptide subunit release factors